ncbi:MAG: hypothetical protein GY856_09920 [bacterium]|nr:hypothetical protein [bacterium]
MSPERWQRFKQVVAAILERDRREWPSCLLAHCGDDVDLFLEVSSLLAFSRSVGDFIEAPAWRVLGSSPALRSGEGNG